VPRAALIAASVALTAVVVGGGVLALGRDGERAPAPTPQPERFSTTPLAEVDTAGVALTRGPFCEAVDERQVEAALGVAPEVQTWQNGDRIDVGGGATDLVHEFGCRYAAPDGGAAVAWVFAPPVAADEAQRMVATAAKGAGCQPGDGPPFGAPTLALSCTTKDGSTRASYRGLFGDTWVVCEVDRPAGATWDVVDRAGRWCVAVLQAAGSQAG
jgi:hypothetical protein